MTIFFFKTSLPFAAIALFAFIYYTYRRQREIFIVATIASVLTFCCLTIVLSSNILTGNVGAYVGEKSRYLHFAWTIMVIYFLAEFHYKIRLLGSILMPIALTLMLISMFTDNQVPAQSLPLGAVITFTHVALVFIGLGLMLLAFAAAVLYLLKTNALKKHLLSALDERLPSLPMLRRVMESAFYGGFPVLTIGLILGVVYAASVLAAGWIWDAKIIWGIANWLLYSILFFLRQSGRLGNQFLARGLILLFLFVITSFFFTTHESILDKSNMNRTPITTEVE